MLGKQKSRLVEKALRIAAAAILLSASAVAQTLYSGPNASPSPQGKPQAIQNVGIDQHLDQQLPLDLQFRD